jgi:hypothetical protein
VRRAVVEAAIVQAVGRVSRRTAANPVDVFKVLHDTLTTRTWKSRLARNPALGPPIGELYQAIIRETLVIEQ